MRMFRRSDVSARDLTLAQAQELLMPMPMPMPIFNPHQPA